MKRNYSVERERVTDRLDDLNHTLKGLLGAKAKLIIEKMIARTLYGKVGMNFEERENWKLADDVAHAGKCQG